jgi:23S rRNA pseudoU1915 N3-methylase RlmH
MDAIITLENKGDLICSKPLAAVGVNMEDQRRNILILLDGGGGAAEKCL